MSDLLLIKIFIPVLLFISIIGSAQYDNIRIKSFSVKDGLSNSNVRSITQDKYGFIWIATFDGLNKYDGYEFTQYRSNEQDSNAIPVNDIRALLNDTKNNLWVGTSKGLCRYSNEKDNFEVFIQEDTSTRGKFDISYILEDFDGKLWLSANMSGAILFDPDKKNIERFVSIPGDPLSLSSNNVQSIFKDSRNNIWVTTIDSGINLYNRNQKSFRNFKSNTNDPYSLAGNDIHSMIEDKKSNLWIACHYNGISSIHVDDILTGKFKNIYHDPKNENSPCTNSPRIVCADRNGGFWMGSEDGRIDFYNDGNFTHYEFKECATQSLIENQTNSIFQDSNDDIWIGTYYGGLHMMHKTNPAFTNINMISHDPENITNNKVWKFAEDATGLIWIATDDGGLNSFNPATGKLTSYTTKNTNLNTDKVLSVYIDSEQRIWIGTWRGGFSLFNPHTKSFKAFTEENSELINNNVFDITEDFDGNLWLATQNGLSKFNIKTESFKTFTSQNSDLIFNQIEVIKTDSFGNLLIGNTMGFLILNPKSAEFTNYINNPENKNSISDNYITSILEESKTVIWIATRNGLNRLDRKTNQIIRYYIKDGLPSNLIMGVETDNKGNIWVSTNFGLSQFNKKTKKFINYGIDEGLQDYLFIKKSHIKTKNGLLYFGGIKGFNIINTDQLIQKNNQTKLIFTEFLISNKVVRPGDKSYILSKNITQTEKIFLTHKHPTFSVRYAAINFINPENMRYAYKLAGFDKEWNYVGNQRLATYTNLDPGKYTLKVIETPGEFINEKEAISLDFQILPPWWKTLIFKILLSFSIVSLIIYFYRLRVNRLKKQQLFLENQIQKRTHDLTKANKLLVDKQNELTEINNLLEETHDEILAQNEELEKHRNHLELLVSERTIELESARKKAEESDHLKSSFLANMSHEIRTPMNAIVGFSSLLDSAELLIEDRKNYIEMINNNCESLNVLINDIIDISLIESNQVAINKSPFHTDVVMNELLNFYKLKNTKDITISFENQAYETNLILNNDPVRFRQILSNLIDNALKYTEKGFVKFGYEIMENYVKFNVTDSGIGINKSDYKNIFNHFRKIEKTESKLYRGVGIGLSISKSMVELMGGEIWLESQPGSGSSFFFTLPYDNEMISSQSFLKKEDIKIVLNLSKYKIIIAEDEPTNFLLLKKFLEPTKAQIIWAKNGLEAVNEIESFSDSEHLIILMDIKMPVMNGIDALKIIRKKLVKVPVIAVTAYAGEKDKAEILRNNFNGYISKPIRPHILFSLIQNLISKPF